MSAPTASLPRPEAPSERARARRLHSMAVDNFQFIWRSLRRLGVPPEIADDAAQRVFEIASRRLAEIEEGHERAFLFKTAILVATEARRAAARSRDSAGDEAIATIADPGPDPEEATDRKRKRLLLDAALDQMTMDLRTVFVLFELEELATAEIAALLEIPMGTVGSRLRRAREQFQEQAKRIRARLSFRGETP
jgi:RNA polymerase sigma-70 factor (ECF subfamily)